MKFLIKRLLKEELNSREILLFNQIAKKRKQLRTKKDIIEFIKDTSKFLGLDDKLANYYYLLWRANYKKGRDFKDISPEEFVGGKQLPQRTISNTQADQYTRGKVPFKGSNLEGEWRTDNNGKDYYVVISYGWYPIYLFKDDVWYKITNTYSSSTSRQMSNADPMEYDSNIGSDVIFVTKPEMDSLMRNKNYEEIMREKREKLIKSKGDFISKSSKFGRSYRSFNEGPNFKVKFKISDLKLEGDKVVVEITIDDVGALEVVNGYTSNKMIPSNGGYLRGEIPGVTKEKAEQTVKLKVLRNFKDYIGKFPGYTADSGYDLSITPEKHNIRFDFIHNKEV